MQPFWFTITSLMLMGLIDSISLWVWVFCFVWFLSLGSLFYFEEKWRGTGSVGSCRELEEVERGECVIRLYCMKNNLF